MKADGTFACRVPRHEAHNPGYFKESEFIFDDETKERLFKLGLGDKHPSPFESGDREEITLVDELRGGRYIYSTDPEYIRVPSNGRLFAAFKSMVNVQLCDRRFQTSYLAKYAAGADEKRLAFIKSRSENANDIEVYLQDLYHAKISGARYAKEEQDRRNETGEALAREISLTEMIWFLLDLPYELAVTSHKPGVLEMSDLFQTLSAEYRRQNPVKSAFFNNFVDSSCLQEVVVVPTPIEPKCFNKFLVHLLFTQGQFETEIDLFGLPSLLHSFQMAGLIRDADAPSEDEANAILKRYVMEDLRVMPLSAQAFSRCLRLAMDGLHFYFRNRCIDYAEVPLASLRSIKIQAEKKVEKLESDTLNRLSEVLLSYNFRNSPSLAILNSGKPFDFVPEIADTLVGQSRNSIDEQKSALLKIITAINSYSRVEASFVKFPLLLGPPGAGKTYLLMLATMYALSKGLQTVTTAVTAERSQLLGGEHLHMMFCLPVSKSKLQSVGIIAENCLGNLLRSPVKLARLKRIDVFIFEEIGLIPGYLFNVIDVVLRRIKNCNYPFGGCLLIASGDAKQLKPIEGRSIFLSPNMYTLFSVMRLDYFVRSRTDFDLQEIIRRMRQPVLVEDEIASVVSKISQRCFPRNCVESWEKVPDSYHRVVGKNSAVEHAERVFVDQKRKTFGLMHCTVVAVDEIDYMSGLFQPANAFISNRLSRSVKEPYELLLYVGQVLRLTFNNTRPTRNLPRFSQGQLVIVTELPNLQLETTEQFVQVKLLPPGCRNFATEEIAAQCPQFKLFRRHTIPTFVGGHGTKARRLQFSLAYYVCSTVHRIIGETCPKLATQISSGRKKFSLWDRDQLLVIISRVSSLDDILFVGSQQDTLLAIKELLAQTQVYDQHIDKVITSCNVLKDGGGILPPLISLPSIATCVPSRDCGFVFMLMPSYVQDLLNQKLYAEAIAYVKSDEVCYKKELVSGELFYLICRKPAHTNAALWSLHDTYIGSYVCFYEPSLGDEIHGIRVIECSTKPVPIVPTAQYQRIQDIVPALEESSHIQSFFIEVETVILKKLVTHRSCPSRQCDSCHMPEDPCPAQAGGHSCGTCIHAKVSIPELEAANSGQKLISYTSENLAKLFIHPDSLKLSQINSIRLRQAVARILQSYRNEGIKFIVAGWFKRRYLPDGSPSNQCKLHISMLKPRRRLDDVLLYREQQEEAIAPPIEAPAHAIRLSNFMGGEEELARSSQHEDLAENPQHEDLAENPQHEDLAENPQHEDLDENPQHEDLAENPQHEELQEGRKEETFPNVFRPAKRSRHR
ncbi:hypothetical protein HAZT_HAZT011898 [Hyalella azteca]|uniref:ATP-dependent DNA helicase n=1 Tax=Hyalella azteca TaxID=294128 RepID=A0A6A0H6H7_HYAAZ|nr:hypothetical protein HAZT_HAZT011898 [Hyalella azteca]